MRPLLACLLLLAAPLHAQTFVDDDATGANDGSSWHDAFTDLQSALAVVGWGQEVWVAEGPYRPRARLDRTASFVPPANVDLYGGFAGTETELSQRAGLFATTILTGDLAGDDGPGFAGGAENSLHVVKVQNVWTTRVDGFTICGGNANVGPEADTVGGGMQVSFPAELVEVDHCTFLENESTGGGGAVFSESASTSYRDCVFQNNRTGGSGGAILQTQFLTEATLISRCRFHGNVARGGGGGAVAIDYAPIVNCVFSGNAADGCASGVGALRIGTGYVVNCSIYGNHAVGAGVGSGGILSGGIISSTAMYIDNSILWGNVDDSGTGQEAQVGSSGGTYPVLRNSCIQGWDGTLASGWVVSADPRFVDPGGADDWLGTVDDDLRLRALSPCIDAADGTIYHPIYGDIDVAGNARFVDTLACDGAEEVLDMGAHERQTIDGTTNHCPARDSSLGVPAILDAPCAPSVAANDFSIAASPVPAGMGVLVFGPGFDRALWSDGILCVGGPLLATSPERTVGGTLSFALDLSPPPGDAIPAGSSWGFQVLYRDPGVGGAGFDPSDAVRCTFRP